MVTKEWAAIHRKHHAKCETAEDPHSPQILGVNRVLCFFFQAEDGIRDLTVTGVQTCALPISKVGDDSVEVSVTVSAREKTGVEMEALTAVAVALLNIWDIAKSYEKDERGQYPADRKSVV